MTEALKTNRRLITEKGRSFKDWWEPINEWLTGRSPIFKSFGLVGVAERHVEHPFFVGKTIKFMPVIRLKETGDPGRNELFLSVFAVAEDIMTCGASHQKTLVSGIHIFDAHLDTMDHKVGWRLCALLDAVFNGVPLDPDHQTELERLLFAP